MSDIIIDLVESILFKQASEGDLVVSIWGNLLGGVIVGLIAGKVMRLLRIELYRRPRD